MGLCLSNKTKSNDQGSSSAPPTLLQSSQLKRFRYSELRKATGKFGAGNYLLGKGGSGAVYKGWINEQSLKASSIGTGVPVAVRRLNSETFQDHIDWLEKVDQIGNISHPNIVGLMGYCMEGDNRLLVYEFMARGNLYNHLLNPHVSPLPWSLRLKVILGVAKGLAFLHSAEVDMMYGPLKTSKVLLDSDFNAKLSSFGITRRDSLTNITDTQFYTSGQFGYLAPEYMATGHRDPSSDVFGFGNILLEVLTGRSKDQRKTIAQWAQLHEQPDKRQLDRLLDKGLNGKYPLNGAHAMGKLAVRCMSKDPDSRPSMAEVVQELEALVQESASSSTS